MRILHLSKNAYKISRWSGGTTREIFIWPENANYATREFSLRISSATVDLEESDFTALPGVTRYIVPLQGRFVLSHPDGTTVAMAPLDPPYRFSGEVETHCVGKATDFNLMLKNTDGIMDICRETAPILPGITCLYAPEGCHFTIIGQIYSLTQGEALVIFSEHSAYATLSGKPIIRCHANP